MSTLFLISIRKSYNVNDETDRWHYFFRTAKDKEVKVENCCYEIYEKNQAILSIVQ